MTCKRSSRNMHIFTECVWMCEHDIACALRWGVALVGYFLCWALLTSLREKYFQVLEVHWETKQVQEIS